MKRRVIITLILAAALTPLVLSRPVAAVQFPTAGYYSSYVAPVTVTSGKYVYIKGGQVYADFAGLPDFVHFPKLDDKYVVAYPAETSEFYYLGRSEVTYTYRTRIIDYITADWASLEKYKKAVIDIGFKNIQEIKSEDFDEYFNAISKELLYDPDFKLDADGIFVAEGYDTFRLLLIGRSVTTYYSYNASRLVDCVEFRFYSLTKTGGDSLDLLSVVGTVDDSLFTGNPGGYYYTPDALGDIREIAATNVMFLFTPTASEDVK